MDFKILLSTFVAIFLAEFADKTQLATLSLSAESRSPLSVFLGASCALILTSLIAVTLGAQLPRIIPIHYIKILAGLVFILLGLFMIVFR